MPEIDVSQLFVKPKNFGRSIFLSGDVCEETAIQVVSSILQFQYEGPTQDITLYIDTYGGDVYAMNTILDVMDMVSCDIRTVVLGKAMSAGAVIFSNGTNGKRFMAPRAFLMFHQVSSGMMGDVKSQQIELEHIVKLQDGGLQTIVKNSGLSYEEVKEMVDRDKYLTPEEAIKLQVCDGIMTRIK